MNKDKCLMYGVAGVAAAGIAVWAGVPGYILFILVCPVMMLFMMAAMYGGMGRNDVKAAGPGADPRTTTPTLDGSHERIDHP